MSKPLSKCNRRTPEPVISRGRYLWYGVLLGFVLLIVVSIGACVSRLKTDQIAATQRHEAEVLAQQEAVAAARKHQADVIEQTRIAEQERQSRLTPGERAAVAKAAAQREAEAKRVAADAAFAASIAASIHDPMTLPFACARWAKKEILDGEATFEPRSYTLSKTLVQTMRGVVIGHNAFGARISKLATCKVDNRKNTYAIIYDHR